VECGKNRIKYPHFSTCMRGFVMVSYLFFSQLMLGPGLAVPSAPVGVVKRPCHSATDTTSTDATTAPA
jgi:hypothetical protein